MKYRHTITVPYQDVDATRRVRLYTMENYLLNIAGKVADAMGFGIPDLLPMNYTWIITHMNMEMLYLPKHGEEMIVETWIERNAHMLSVRDFRIYQAQEDGTERLIGCAKSVWAVLDLTSREIVNIFDHEMFEGSVDGEMLNMARAPRLKPIQLDDIEDEEEEALILKEIPSEGAEEALYDIVEDEKELTAVAAIFEELLDDLELVTQE